MRRGRGEKEVVLKGYCFFVKGVCEKSKNFLKCVFGVILLIF